MADLPVDRTLSPSIPHDWLAVPRLSTLCLNLLMSPCEPSHLPPLLDAYEWDTFEAGRIHPLLDAAVLHQLIPNIPEVDLRRVLQAMKSAGSSHALSMSDNRRGSTSFLLGAPQPGKVDPFPRSHRPVTPDDASINPWFYPCPSPRHLEFGTSFPEAVKRSRNLFLHPAEERIEWRDVFGITALPIRWLGCSPGCLAFVEEEEGDDWGLDEG